VYTVAQVRQLPAAWEGRTVLVRGLVAPCPWWGRAEQALHCAGRLLVLLPGPTEAPAAPLPLIALRSRPLMGFLHDVPLLGRLLPRMPDPPRVVRSIYRLRLLAAPAAACAAHHSCLEAQWLDAPSAGPLETSLLDAAVQ
jgi:hypothetical protein